MPGQFVLEGGRVSVVGEDTENQLVAFQQHVDPLKFVNNVFINIDGTAEVWCELELGNQHDKPIRINEVHIGFNNIGHGDGDISNIGSATTSYTDFDEDESPLLMESTPGGSQEKWQEMYEGYNLLEDDSPYFDPQAKDCHGNDRIFEYRLGPGSPHQHVYTIPVEFKVKHRRAGENTTHPYIIKKIRKLSDRDTPSAESPVILPDEELEEGFDSRSRFDHPDSDEKKFEEATRRDSISLWIYWEEDDLCVPKDDISYHFRYAVDCDIQEKLFSRAYPHYILPDDSVLMGKSMLMESLSEDKIEEFHPPEERWMFKHWEEEYNVENMSSARMTRSKVKGKDHVFNSGRIGFPALRARHTALQFVLVILSGWAIESAFNSLSWSKLITSPIPSNEAWPLVILPISGYLLLKGYGPPPYFPASLRFLILPTEKYVLAPVKWLIVSIMNIPRLIIKKVRKGFRGVQQKLGLTGENQSTQNQSGAESPDNDDS